MGIEQRFGLDEAPAASPRRVLAVTCGNHAVHDGYTDTLYLLLPLWQAEFQLSYAAVGIMRALYSAVLAAFQVPAASLAVRVSPVLLLAAGTALSGLAYMLAGASAGLPLLVVSLMLGGLGSSTLHPIGSDLVASAFHGKLRAPGAGHFQLRRRRRQDGLPHRCLAAPCLHVLARNRLRHRRRSALHPPSPFCCFSLTRSQRGKPRARAASRKRPLRD